MGHSYRVGPGMAREPRRSECLLRPG